MLAEFGRVLRPGGRVLITDLHPEQVARGVIPPLRRADGSPARLTTYRHRVGDYVRAALAAGLEVRGCAEPGMRPAESDEPRASGPGPWELWPWSLARLAPEAAEVAGAGVPVMLQWELRRPGAAA
ncbi:hypothetical protein [Streptomyces sp. VRA16 Mangrove soil]|uniref:hypothetical protein n=1 Tax=Streptomyces sp. VRA16 Mangrove soil TaxID=2817434 RepID=UPI001E569AD2|nr:hypothetical protein [Streptomyces sp. VRA16 Mangrove soil]